MKKEQISIVVVGAGKVATHLSLALKQAGHKLLQVYSRTEASAKELSDKLDCSYTVIPETLRTDADLYLFSLKDSALASVISRMQTNNGLWVHTAGSMPLDIFEGHATQYGVLYPLQTFSKNREVAIKDVPFFVEANDKENENKLTILAQSISNKVQPLSSEKRKYIHLAAVFACNFTNHCYAIAADLLEKQGIPFDVLLPLADETAAKVHSLSPKEAQTGPAVRYDENVISKHLELLPTTLYKELYELLSQSIHSSIISSGETVTHSTPSS